jgi:hypothetical protein
VTAATSKCEIIKARLRVPLMVVLVLATAGLMRADVSAFMADAAARRWTPMPAEITKLDFPITVRLKDPYFEPRVEYKYTYDGKEYTGTRLSFYKLSPLLGYDSGLYEESHKTGTQVNVQVEPGKPDNAVLEPVSNPMPMICHLIAIMMFCALIYFSAYPVVRRVNSPA